MLFCRVLIVCQYSLILILFVLTSIYAGQRPAALGRAEIQAGTGSEDEGMSSDGERGGEEYYDEYFEGIGADAALEDGEFGGGPWSGEDPYACGGEDLLVRAACMTLGGTRAVACVSSVIEKSSAS